MNELTDAQVALLAATLFRPETGTIAARASTVLTRADQYLDWLKTHA